jgi:hypothetical protein
MQVAIKHNSTTITSRVISYNRQHQICTSVGTCDLTLDGTYSTVIEPFDSFDIYENGDFKVRYYVSDVGKLQPDGTIEVHCQDKSKYLTDYFISSSYTIDYPSYTRYWIEKFLTEASVSYNFGTSSQGNLISNDTVLGLQPAYDQIMMLLQLSGWFMYFDGNGIAVIGTLDTDLASSAGHLGKTDILEIKVITDDKMLRNRAVVWGQYDVFNKEYAYADVSKNTPWNYDSRDKRAMVISNNNIPNKRSAYNIANILLKEFARATIEKHITAWGARDYNLGEMVSVNSNIWRGKGMITTFGVTMDRNGLVTNVILDERCPRLFGFFNFGDWVYVSTFGSGVWRKHIKFDPAWYNFSTGLTDLKITDLHINQGIFGSVGHSGAAYYAAGEDGPWHSITLSSLMSSQEDDVPSGTMVTYVPFSGLMARAVIVDKAINTVKFGIDIGSGINYGDYFLAYSGVISSGVASSGISTSGVDMRSWIVEYDPYTGLPIGGLGSGIYPVVYSGSYDFLVVDLENDGLNDYISVSTTASGISWSDGYNFGRREETRPIQYTNPSPNMSVSFSDLEYDLEGQTVYGSQTGSTVYAIYNNELDDERDLVYINGSTGTANRIHVSKQFSVTLGTDELISTLTTSPALSLTGTVEAIYKTSIGIYKIFSSRTVAGGAGVLIRYERYVKTWDSLLNTVSGSTLVGVVDILNDASKPDSREAQVPITVIIDGTIYTFIAHGAICDTGGLSATDITNYIEMYAFHTVMSSNSMTAGFIQTIDFRSRSTGSSPVWQTSPINSVNNPPIPVGQWLFVKNNAPYIAFFLRERDALFSPTSLENWLITSDGGLTFTKTSIQTATVETDPNFLNGILGTTLFTSQVHDNSILIYGRANGTSSFISYTFNGNTLYIRDDTAGIPYYCTNANIYSMFSCPRREYIAKNGSSWVWIDIDTMLPALTLTMPTGYTIQKPFSVSVDNSEQFFWYATRTSDSRKVILKLNRAAGIESVINPFDQPNFSAVRGIVAGNFFIDSPTSSAFGGTSSNNLQYVYVDNIHPGTPGNNYLVLQREGSEFNLIQQASKPMRVDISNNSPVLTVRDVENTFQSNFVFGQELTQVIPISGLDSTKEVRDYRYALLEVASGVIVASGSGVDTQILYVNQSGIYTSDANAYSGGFILYAAIPSGYAERIETSNFTYPGQFIFVTTSGDSPMFFQKNNDGLIFNSYSGLPNSRATCIRLDDRL